jgi:hypothetical protein
VKGALWVGGALTRFKELRWNVFVPSQAWTSALTGKSGLHYGIPEVQITVTAPLSEFERFDTTEEVRMEYEWSGGKLVARGLVVSVRADPKAGTVTAIVVSTKSKWTPQ